MTLNTGSTMSWLALSMALAVVVAFQLSDDADFAPTVTAAPVEAVVGEPDDVAPANIVMPSLDLMNDIVGRPLFSASRRPEEVVIDEQPEDPAVPAQKLTFELVGTMLTGESRMVLLKHPNDGLLRLREGQTVEGWEVGRIDHNLVELKNGDEVEELKLRTDLLQPRRQGQKNAPKAPDKQGVLKAPVLPDLKVDGKGAAAEILRRALPLAQQQ